MENDLWMKSLQLRVQFEIVAPLVCKLTMQMTIMTESSNGSLLDAELYSLLSNISL